MEKKFPIVLLGLDEKTSSEFIDILQQIKGSEIREELDLFAIDYLDIDNVYVGKGKEALEPFFKDRSKPSPFPVLIIAGGVHFDLDTLQNLKDTFPHGSVLGLGHVEEDQDLIKDFIDRRLHFIPMNETGIHKKILLQFLNNEVSRISAKASWHEAQEILKKMHNAKSNAKRPSFKKAWRAAEEIVKEANNGSAPTNG